MNKVKFKIKEIAEVKNGSTPSTKNEEYYDGDIIWITPKDLSNQNSRYTYKGERSITKAGFESCSATMVPEGTVLLSSRAPIGLLSIAGVELCTNQGFKNIIPIRGKVDSEFLFYYLKIKIPDIEKLGSGTTFKEVSKASLENFAVVIPEDINHQQGIAAVLSALDAKIELNQRINAELESMAKTLYDYWFVQFDFPNEKGKPYKSAGGKMVWNEELKREIPLGWEVGVIEQVCERISSGGTPSTKRKELYDGVIPWYATNELQDKVLLSSNKTISKQALEESSAKLFPSGTILIAIYAAPTVGRLGILTKESAFNQACCGIIANEIVISTEYMFLCFLSMRKLFNTIASGTAQKNLSVGQIKNLNILIPPEETNLSFKYITKALFEMIERKQKESQTLTELRDWLLPMLMNGQVRA